MRKQGFILLGILAVLLAGVLAYSLIAPPGVTPPPGTTPSPPPEEQLLNAVMDRIGVTRWSEALGWYEMQQAGLLDGNTTGDTPVWTGRDPQGTFHSLPICGGLKAPVRRTLAEALEMGYVPCEVCWNQEEAS